MSFWLAVLLALARVSAAEVAVERVGEVATLAQPPSPHWIWVSDFVLHRSALLDADEGRFLGAIAAGLGPIAPQLSPSGHEIYLPETHYARGTRGARTDVVTAYEAATLRPVAEIAVPPKRADVAHATALSALLDDGRFLVLYNFTPAMSVSVVDVIERRFAGEIATPGCGLVYAAGARRFAMLCGDGTLLVVSLDERGAESARVRSQRFFDPIADPVTEKAVRVGGEWLFVSFDGFAHPVDLSGEAPRFGEPWSLLTEADRAASWRIGGTQHLAAHGASRRLYALVHVGGPHGHKEAGTEVWVYDLATRARVQSIELRSLTGAFAAQMAGVSGGVLGWLVERLVADAGVDSIAVTQDGDPRLLAVSQQAGTVGIYDARSGAWLRNLEQVGLAPSSLLAPWR